MLVQSVLGDLPVDAGLLLPAMEVGELVIDGPPLPGELRDLGQLVGEPVVEVAE